MSSKHWLIFAAMLLAALLLGLGHGLLSALGGGIFIKLILMGGLVAAMTGILSAFGEHVLDESRLKTLPLYAAAMALVSLHGSWCGWVWQASDFKHFLVLHPIDLSQLVMGLSDKIEYTASSRGSTVGVAQASVRWAWICEAVVIALGPVLTTVFAVFGRKEPEW